MEHDIGSMTEILTGGAFLSENREAYELVSDAYPVATDRLLVAVNGYAPEDGMHPPTFTVPVGGIEGLYEKLYGELIASNEVNDHILRLTFGNTEGRQTHPLARYSAALAETVAFDILSHDRDENGQPLSAEACARRLSRELPRSIDALRDVIRNETGPRPGSERFFAVSLGACRVTPAEAGVFHIDMFSAGDFSLFLLDEHGMCPLWVRETELISCGDCADVTVERLTVNHPEPFALLLLSKGICEPSASDQRGIAEHPGLIWRHRMRLEDLLIDLMTSGVDPSDVSERAIRLLAGRCPGWDSVSGAFTVCGGSFDAFKTLCVPRQTRLEHMIALFPNGYDPEDMPEPTLKEDVEEAFVLNTFRTRPRILEKTKETLSLYAADILREGGEGAPTVMLAEDGEREDLLNRRTVRAVFDAYDSENTEDRHMLATNQRHIRDLLSEHWLTLRPLLCREAEDTPQGQSAYEACLRLQKHITRLTAYRRSLLDELRRRLTVSLEVLDFQGEDWLRGRSGGDSVQAWFDSVANDLPALTENTRKEWERLSDCLRGLRSAYTSERARLFDLDTRAEDRAWGTAYQNILNGTLPPDIWRSYRRAVEESIPAYEELLRLVKALSDRNNALRQRILDRAAERKTANAIAENETWQISCLLGALREDGAWGETCLKMIDNGLRNEYRAAIRRWQEDTELLLRQKEAFGLYRDMYHTFITE